MSFPNIKVSAFPPIVAASIFAFSLVSCENPADETPDAKVQDAVEKVQPDENAQQEQGVDVQRYVFSSKSKIEWTGSKDLGGAHDGGFSEFTGYFTLSDGKPVGSDHVVEINMKSLYSDDDRLTKHLSGEDFFEIDKYPKTIFDATEIKQTGDTSYDVSGNLTMHGQTKNITFPAEVSMEGTSAVISAEFDITRSQWGISYKKALGDDFIRDEVILRLNLIAAPQTDEQKAAEQEHAEKH